MRQPTSVDRLHPAPLSRHSWVEVQEEKKVENETGEEKKVEDGSAPASSSKENLKRVDTPTVDKFKPLEDADDETAAQLGRILDKAQKAPAQV